MLDLIKTQDKTNVEIFLLSTLNIGFEAKTYDKMGGYLSAVHKTFQIENNYLMCIANIANCISCEDSKEKPKVLFDARIYDTRLNRIFKTEWLKSYRLENDITNCTWEDIVHGFIAQPQPFGAKIDNAKLDLWKIPYNEYQDLRAAKSYQLL